MLPVPPCHSLVRLPGLVCCHRCHLALLPRHIHNDLVKPCWLALTVLVHGIPASHVLLVTQLLFSKALLPNQGAVSLRHLDLPP